MAKILIVDDNDTNRKLLVTLLSHEGYETVEARDGHDALRKVRLEHPQLVMSDILMPTMDGYEFVRQLRADPTTHDTPVVFHTAYYHEREARTLAEQCGVRRVLAKPSSTADILRAVTEALDAGPTHSPDGALTATFDHRHLELITNKLSQSAEELQAANSRFAALIDLNVQLASERDPKILLERVCQAARELLCAKFAVLAVHGPDNGDVSFYAVSGIDRSKFAVRAPSVHAGTLGSVYAMCQTFRVYKADAAIDIGLPEGYPPAGAFIAAPLSSLTRTYGWLCLGDKLGAAGFDAEDERILSVLGAQTGRIYENGSLYREVEQHAKRLLEEMEKRERATADLRESESRFRQLAENIQDVFYLFAADWSRLLYLSPAFETIWGRPRSEVYANALAWGDWIHPDDVAEFRRASGWDTNGQSEVKRLEFRIVRPDGAVRWILTRSFPVAATETSAARIAGVATDITARKEAEERIRHLNRVYAVLSGINSLIVRVHDRGQLLNETCRLAVDTGQFGFAWCGWCAPDSPAFTDAAWSGGSEALVELIEARGPDGGRHPSICNQALTAAEPMVWNAIATAPVPEPLRKQLLRNGYRAVAVLPLVISDKVVGCLILATAEDGFFDDEEMRLLLELAGDISFALDHIQKLEQLNYLAYYDVLTGLANRTFFHERLALHVNTAARSERKLALLIVQIERFDSVAETLGRHAADQLLRELAQRLKAAAGADTDLARIGPDQFAVVMPDVLSVGEAKAAAEKLLPLWLGLAFNVDGAELRLSANAGVAMFPADCSDGDTLLKHAQAALKRARATGDRLHLYTSELSDGGSERLTLESKLRRALESDEFALYYQPKVELATRRLTGVEALIRWHDPEAGVVPPARFIPLMEETGMIAEVGGWVVEQACRDHARWREAGLPAPRIAVNVSTVQLRRTDFVQRMSDALRAAGNVTGIDVEVTESLLMRDVEDNIAKLSALRDLGIHIAIDDFGTGYSSLGYLTKLPAEVLKIDRSFIHAMLDDPSAMTLVSTIISLAHALRLEVVAEGVESEEQAKILRLVRCDQMQGYLVSKPLPFDEMTSFLRGAADR